MLNPIYQAMTGTRQNGIANMVSIYNQARNSIANPEAMVRSMLTSGKMTQAQLDALGREATQIMRMAPGMFK